MVFFSYFKSGWFFLNCDLLTYIALSFLLQSYKITVFINLIKFFEASTKENRNKKIVK